MAEEDDGDSFDYAKQIRDADSDSLRRLCFSAGLSRSGNAPAKRNRLLSYAAGSARRQRIYWLELFLVAEQAGFDPSGSGPFDFTMLDDDNADVLSDFFDNVHVSGTTATEFSRCLPHRLLPDCERDGDDFSVPDSFLWPSKRAMLAFLSDEDSPSSSASSTGSAVTSDIRLKLDKMPEQIMTKMVKDISENRLGEYLHLCPGFLPEYALCCVRSAFEIYYQRTKNLPIETMYDDRRPTEPIQRLLLSTKKRNGKYFGMSPTSVGPLIKEQLRLSGIDVKKFQAHIVRSASIALQLGQGNDKDVTLQNAGVSLKVFSIHYNMPLQVSQVPPSLQSMKGDAVAHCLTATSAAAVPTPTVTLPPAGRGQNNSQLCALPPTDAGRQLALEPNPMEQLAAPIRASNGQSKISYTDQEVQLMLGL